MNTKYELNVTAIVRTGRKFGRGVLWSLFLALAWSLVSVSAAKTTDYHVGPGQTYTTIGAVPWYNLQAGDTVYIHYRTSAQGGAYHENSSFLVRVRRHDGFVCWGFLGRTGTPSHFRGQRDDEHEHASPLADTIVNAVVRRDPYHCA